MKKKILIIIGLLFLIGIIVLACLYSEQKVTILGYHSFYKDKKELTDGKTDVINDIAKFEEQIKYLSDHNYKSLTMDEFYCWKKNKCKQPRKSVLITMDDGYLSNYMYAFPVLKKYNMKATVFFVGSSSKNYGVSKGTIYDYMSLDLIKKCKKEYPNIEFHSHSYGLHGKPVYEWSDEELSNDIKNMKTIDNFEYYAYPFGVYDDRMIKLLKDNKYKLAFGFGPGKEHRKARRSDNDYVVPRLNISDSMSMTKFKLRLIIPF